MNLTVLGAGAWGTALAVSVCSRHPTTLWARDPAQVERMRRDLANPRYLPGVALPASLAVTGDFDRAAAHAADGLVFIATPMAALADVLARLRGSPAGVFWLCKGFQQATGWLGQEIAAQVAPGTRVGVLSGPSFAIEVARGQPTALVAASREPGLCDAAVAALHGDGLRIYTSADPIGVEVGGAVKNVFAIASGIADAMPGEAGRSGLGLNALAALITRSLAEMTRLGVALGAQSETFMGLSGLGDLVLTMTGDLSRNRQVGQLLAQGRGLAEILAELRHVAEGVATAPMVLQRARAVGVEMPIAEAVAGVIAGTVSPARALEQLMGRGARPEH